jgi:hypothetical protein
VLARFSQKLNQKLRKFGNEVPLAGIANRAAFEAVAKATALKAAKK